MGTPANSTREPNLRDFSAIGLSDFFFMFKIQRPNNLSREVLTNHFHPVIVDQVPGNRTTERRQHTGGRGQ